MNSIHKQRLFLMIIALIGAVSVFLPWLKKETGSSMGITHENAGYLTLICLVGTIILCTFGEKTKPLQGIYQIGAALLCGIATIIGIAKVLSVIGIGLVLLQLCGAAGIAIALNVSKKKDDGIKEIE